MLLDNCIFRPMKHTFLFLFLIFAFAKAYTQEISPQTQKVDIINITALVRPDFREASINGDLEVTFTALEDVKEVLLDAKKMTIENLSKEFVIKALEDHISIQGPFDKGQTYTRQFTYRVVPKQALYFVDAMGTPQVWTQGQGKYTSYWLPSIDDMNDKIEFDLTIEAPKEMTVIASGYSKSVQELEEYNVWQFDMVQPMSSYLVALVIGTYDKKIETSTSGIPLEYYYYPKDTLKVEPTYRYSKQIFDFLEKEIGVAYPWQNYKQVPVKDFLYAGMENTSLTIFSDSFVVDSIGFTDRNYVNVNAHELAHQWFGDLVTETKSEHHWLHEGFATYYALLAEREIFGDDYFYYKLYESAEQLRELSDTGKGQKLVASGGSSLTYYQKGAWALHILREKIGSAVFAKAVRNYLTTYAFKNVTTTDFITEVEVISGQDLEDYKKAWLYQSAFQATDALKSLKKSPFMRSYFELQSLRPQALKNKVKQLGGILSLSNDYLGQEGVYQLLGENASLSNSLYEIAFSNKNVYTRQAIATSMEAIPNVLLPRFKSLLVDKSYVTREQSFLKLWLQYRSSNALQLQHTLLDRYDSQFGFSDGNIRVLWLTLSLATQNYKPDTANNRFKELASYTEPSQPFQLRENAFQYLFQIQSFDEVSLKNLVEACVHHTWRFRESARKLLNELYKDEGYRIMLNNLETKLSEKEIAYIARIKKQ